MANESFIVGGWSSGDTLGFNILEGGLQYFPKGLQEVRLWLPGNKEPVIVNLRRRQRTFWTTCSELANAEITRWLIKNGYKKWGPKWPRGRSPRFRFTKIKKGEFKVSKIT